MSGLAVAERVLCLFGSCGWAAGVNALGPRLGPPIIEAWRELDLPSMGIRKPGGGIGNPFAGQLGAIGPTFF